MANRQVSVERHVRQVRDGLHYRGYLKIDDTKLDYEILFGVPIDKLDNTPLATDEATIRRLFQISVKRDGRNIELTKDEYGFFFSMVAEFAVGFYNLPQTRGSNEGLSGATLRGEGAMALFGASMSIGITSNGVCDFPPELCEMLSASKFGCALTA